MMCLLEETKEGDECPSIHQSPFMSPFIFSSPLIKRRLEGSKAGNGNQVMMLNIEPRTMFFGIIILLNRQLHKCVHFANTLIKAYFV